MSEQPVRPPWFDGSTGQPAAGGAGAPPFPLPAAGTSLERAKPTHGPDGRFVKGGGGRPRGSKNKATVAIEAIFEGEAERIGRRTVELALAGDPTALKIVMDRIAPVRRGRPLQGLARRSNESSVEALLRAVLEGELTPEEGKDVVGMIESAARIAATKVLAEQRQEQMEALRRAGESGALGGGVMLVPLHAGEQAWEAAAVEAQARLVASAKHREATTTTRERGVD